jgi:hypothetical protein
MLYAPVYASQLNLIMPEVTAGEIYRKFKQKLNEMKALIEEKIFNDYKGKKDKDFYVFQQEVFTYFEIYCKACLNTLEAIIIHPTVFAIDWDENIKKLADKRVANQVAPYSTNSKKQKAERINDCIAFESILVCLKGILATEDHAKRDNLEIVVIAADSDYGNGRNLHTEIKRDLMLLTPSICYFTDIADFLKQLPPTDEKTELEDSFCRTCRLMEKPYLRLLSDKTYKCHSCSTVFMEHKENTLPGIGIVCPSCRMLNSYIDIKEA